MRKILFIALSGWSMAVNAQMGIGNNTPKGTLDITALKTDGSTPEGILIPRLTGDQIKNAGNQYTTTQTGAMVYATSAPSATDTKTANITAAGCYYFDGSVWRSLGESTNTTVVSISATVDTNILGYTPSKTATASGVPATISVAGVTCTKQAVTNYSVNGHTYTVYLGTAGISWFDAYNAAKSIGGYLATFTTDGEWQNAEQNLLTNNTAFDTQKAWIGFVKFSWYAGSGLVPDPEMKWITGEQPLHIYSIGGTDSVKKTNWFASGEPNNYGSGEGFVHTWAKNDIGPLTSGNYTSTHPWNDYPSNVANVYAFIVEFQQ